MERTLIDPSILESVKAITACIPQKNLITRRDEVKTMIQQKISSFLNESTEEFIRPVGYSEICHYRF